MVEQFLQSDRAATLPHCPRQATKAKHIVKRGGVKVEKTVSMKVTRKLTKVQVAEAVALKLAQVCRQLCMGSSVPCAEVPVAAML